MLIAKPRKDAVNDLILSIILPLENKEEVIIANVLLDNIFKRNIDLIEQAEDKIIKSGFIISGEEYQLNDFILSPEIKSNILQGKSGIAAGYLAAQAGGDGREKSNFVYSAFKIGDEYWGIVLAAPEAEILKSITANINEIWHFAIGIIISFIAVGFIFNYSVIASLKKEVAAQTIALLADKQKIQAQLGKEEVITREKEKLLVEREKAKKELEDKLGELEKFQQLTVDRELKTIKLKEKIKKIKDKE